MCHLHADRAAAEHGAVLGGAPDLIRVAAISPRVFRVVWSLSDAAGGTLSPRPVATVGPAVVHGVVQKDLGFPDHLAAGRRTDGGGAETRPVVDEGSSWALQLVDHEVQAVDNLAEPVIKIASQAVELGFQTVERRLDTFYGSCRPRRATSVQDLGGSP